MECRIEPGKLRPADGTSNYFKYFVAIITVTDAGLDKLITGGHLDPNQRDKKFKLDELPDLLGKDLSAQYSYEPGLPIWSPEKSGTK